MRVRGTGRPTELAGTDSLGTRFASGFVHKRGYSEPETKASNADLAAQAVNAYPQVEASLRRHAHRIAQRARTSYLSMIDTGDFASSVSVSREKTVRGVYAGSDIDFIVEAHGEGLAHLEWGHFQGKRGRGEERRRWVPGRHVMANAAKGAGAATPARLRQLSRARARRRQVNDRPEA